MKEFTTKDFEMLRNFVEQVPSKLSNWDIDNIIEEDNCIIIKNKEGISIMELPKSVFRQILELIEKI